MKLIYNFAVTLFYINYELDKAFDILYVKGNKGEEINLMKFH